MTWTGRLGRPLPSRDQLRILVVMAINVATMAISYGYQVLAARELSSASLVSLNQWLGQLGLLSVVGIFAQIRGSLASSASSRPRATHVQFGVAILLLIGHLSWPVLSSPAVLLAEAFALTVLSSFAVGECTRSMQLVRASSAGFFGAAMRVGYPILFARVGDTAFWQANVLASAAVWAFAVAPGFSSAPAPRLEPQTNASRWSTVLVVGALQSVMPFAQFFLIRWMGFSVELGSLAKVLVITRAPLLLAIALFNIALAADGRTRATSFLSMIVQYKYSLSAVLVCTLGIPMAVVLGPLVLHLSQTSIRWLLFASSVHHAAIAVLFARVQRHVLASSLRRALVLVGASTVPALAMGFVSLQNAATVLCVLALAGFFVAAIDVAVTNRRSHPMPR